MTYTTKELMEQLITTYDGTTTAQRKQCRYIKGSFYIKNKQCFLIEGKWYRINSNYIVYDHYNEVWVLKANNPNLVDGIVGFEADKETPKIGSFTPNPIVNTKFYYKGATYKVLNLGILENIPNITEGLTGCYYNTKEKGVPKEFTAKLKPRRDHYYSFPFNYGSDELIPVFKESFDREFFGKPLLTKNAKYTQDFTFGVEFETERGTIPERFLKPNGLIACRDGSITGFEYVTIPLHGNTGIQAIKTHCELLKKYCSCSPFESMHIHLGGYPKNVKAIASLYRLACLIQNEVYSMFPYYYKDTSHFKKKSYCNPLPVLDESATTAAPIFNSFYRMLSGGDSFNRFPVGNHPMDHNGLQKWTIAPRYVWLNLIPLIWGKRGTVEFRCHTPTVNANKVINWIYITMGILNFAKKHQVLLTSQSYTQLVSDSEGFSLANILSNVYPAEIAKVLNTYINERKIYYKDKNDHVGEQEIFNEEKGDNTFTLIPLV